MQFYIAVDEKPHPSCPYCEACPPHMLSAGIWTMYMLPLLAYTSEDQLMRATEVVHLRFIAAEGTGYPAPIVLNLEPEGTQRCLDMSIECVCIIIVVSFYSKVADDWIRHGRAIQVRLPSAPSNVSGATQHS